MSRLEQFHDAKDIDKMFPEQGPMTVAPWPAASRSRIHKDYDQDRVKALMEDRNHELVHIDPRTLHKTQPNITRAGVKHYMDPANQESGATYADQHNVGNQTPVVYAREDGQNLLLSGHHRAAAALLQGRQFAVRRIEGPWGPRRDGGT